MARHGSDSGVRNLSCTKQFPRHGFCTADLPRKSAGYRSLFAGQPNEAVQHGFSCASQTFDTGRRQRSAQLAHVGRFGDIADSACTQTVLQRQLWCRSDQYGLCTRCDDYRLVPIAVSMGTVSHQQGGSQTAYTLLDLRGNIPAFIHITDGKTHEFNVLDTLSFEAGAFYVMDRPPPTHIFFNNASKASGASGSNSSIRLLGQVVSFQLAATRWTPFLTAYIIFINIQ